MTSNRDRLIELLTKEVARPKAYALTDHLLANGVIAPPCKVGDTVYMIFENEIRELRVISLSYLFSSSFNHFNLHTENSRGAVLSYEMKDIGKSVFLTKEEAEEKLNEMNKGE